MRVPTRLRILSLSLSWFPNYSRSKRKPGWAPIFYPSTKPDVYLSTQVATTTLYNWQAEPSLVDSIISGSCLPRSQNSLLVIYSWQKPYYLLWRSGCGFSWFLLLSLLPQLLLASSIQVQLGEIPRLFWQPYRIDFMIGMICGYSFKKDKQSNRHLVIVACISRV